MVITSKNWNSFSAITFGKVNCNVITVARQVNKEVARTTYENTDFATFSRLPSSKSEINSSSGTLNNNKSPPSFSLASSTQIVSEALENEANNPGEHQKLDSSNSIISHKTQLFSNKANLRKRSMRPTFDAITFGKVNPTIPKTLSIPITIYKKCTALSIEKPNLSESVSLKPNLAEESDTIDKDNLKITLSVDTEISGEKNCFSLTPLSFQGVNYVDKKSESNTNDKNNFDREKSEERNNVSSMPLEFREANLILTDTMQENSNAKEFYTCDLCKKLLHNLSTYNRHMNIHNKPVVCHVCNKQFKEKTNLKKHLLIHTGLKPYTCAVCGRSFRSKVYLEQHNLTHTGEKPYPCQMCSKKFADRSARRKHYRTHTGEKPFECEICHKGFTEMARVKEHSVTHTRMRDFVCQVCNYRFTTKSSLQRHLTTHMNIRPFVCDVCNKSFKRQYSLKEHETVHRNKKPYTCDICGKAFARKPEVVLHKISHSDLRPFSCDRCGTLFKTSRSLRRHCTRHKCIEDEFREKISTKSTCYEESLVYSEENCFACKKCSIVFLSESIMKRHIRCMHNTGKGC